VVPYPAHEPTFLPLTVAAACAAASDAGDPLARGNALVVRSMAEEANRAAADCWAAMLAGCDSSIRRALITRLNDLSEATSCYAGVHWWLGRGSLHRTRVVAAEVRIDEAVREGDGADFAEAFVGYDQAVATVVVHAQNRLGSPTT
jgi:hypothetical protein